MPLCSGIVLAGGRSRRMGRDKAALALDGITLLEHAVAALTPVTDDIVVVGPRRDIELPGQVIVVQDEIPGAGPLAGLLTGLRQVRYDYALAVACDMPFLDPHVLRLLLHLVGGHDAAIPLIDGRGYPFPGVYTRRITPAIERHILSGRLKLRALLNDLDVRWVGENEIGRLDPDHRSLVNVNTAAEWQAAARRSGATPGT
jgi:molybdopterin-guanine dinucleotide biosynthesis protein A